MFVTSHVVVTLVLAISVAGKEFYHLVYIIFCTSVICIIGLLCKELVVTVALFVKCFALQGGEFLYVIYVVAPVLEE